MGKIYKYIIYTAAIAVFSILATFMLVKSLSVFSLRSFLGLLVLFLTFFLFLTGFVAIISIFLKKDRIYGFTADSIPVMLIIFLWIVIPLVVAGFAVVYAEHGILNSEGKIVHDFYECFYFSMIVFTTVGFGDYLPTKELQLIVTFEAFWGYLFISVSIVFYSFVLNSFFSRQLVPILNRVNRVMDEVEKRLCIKGEKEESEKIL